MLGISTNPLAKSFGAQKLAQSRRVEYCYSFHCIVLLGKAA